jgi:hypothetical protein
MTNYFLKFSFTIARTYSQRQCHVQLDIWMQGVQEEVGRMVEGGSI